MKCLLEKTNRNINLQVFLILFNDWIQLIELISLDLSRKSVQFIRLEVLGFIESL